MGVAVVSPKGGSGLSDDRRTDANLVEMDSGVDGLLSWAEWLDVAPIPPPPAKTPSVPVVPPPVEASVVEDVPATGSIVNAVPLTFYICVGAPAGYDDGYCGGMASGTGVYRGAAACGYAWPLGTQFTIEGDPTGLVYTCEDRGLGPSQWVDVWFYDYVEGRAWRNQLPKYVTMEVKE